MADRIEEPKGEALEKFRRQKEERMQEKLNMKGADSGETTRSTMGSGIRDMLFKPEKPELPPKPPALKKKGGVIKSSASRRADGIAQRGKTKGRMI
jgi:hypothetical protein